MWELRACRSPSPLCGALCSLGARLCPMSSVLLAITALKLAGWYMPLLPPPPPLSQPTHPCSGGGFSCASLFCLWFCFPLMWPGKCRSSCARPHHAARCLGFSFGFCGGGWCVRCADLAYPTPLPPRFARRFFSASTSFRQFCSCSQARSVLILSAFGGAFSGSLRSPAKYS